MGSSTRNTSDAIKKLLNKSDDKIIDIDEIMPEVTKEVIRSKKTKNFFGDSDFEVIVGGGFASFKKIKDEGFNNFVSSFDVDPNNITELDVEKIVSSILDAIEDNEDIGSLLLLESFRTAYSIILLKRIEDINEAIRLFLKIVIKNLVETESKEEILGTKADLNGEQLTKSIDEQAELFVNTHFNEIIPEYVNGTIDTKEFIKRIQEIIDSK